MKKILLLMMLVCVIVVGIFNTNLGFTEVTWGEDAQYKVTTTSLNIIPKGTTVNCGDSYITECEDFIDYIDYTSVSAYGTDYSALNKFIDVYELMLVDRYWVEGALVSSYYSPWFGDVTCGANFQVADLGNYYVVGHPLIFEGF